MLESVVKLIEDTRDARIIIGILFLALVFSLKEVYGFWDIISKRKLLVLKYLLKENGATGKAKKIVQEQINCISISHATGIKADKCLQEKVIDLHKFANGRLTYPDLRKTLPFLEVGSTGIVEVRRFTTLGRFTRSDKIALFSADLIYVLIVLAGILSLGLYVFLQTGKLSIRLIMLLFSLYFLGAGFYYGSIKPSFKIIKKVNEEILRNQDELLKYSSGDGINENSHNYLTESAKNEENFGKDVSRLALLNRITISPKQCGGRPCIRSMRIRVVDVLDLFAAGLSAEQVLEELPDLEMDDLKASLTYASRKLDYPTEETPWWIKVAGSFENDSTFDEAVRLGEEWRRSAE